MRNTKIKEGLKEKLRSGDQRLGLNEPTSTRWGSKDDQISNMIYTKKELLTVCNSQEYSRYATGTNVSFLFSFFLNFFACFTQEYKPL